MRTVSTIAEIRDALTAFRNEGKSVGFVPTMGTLHEGHVSLLERSKKENDISVCSIFVNPVQFNNKEDLVKYPRNLASDQKVLEKHECDLLFAPSEAEMYPEGKPENLNVDLGYLEHILEGKYRPGHFKGVALVVKKLFDIIKPDKAYFGLKDYQQLLIIEEMVKQLALPVKIVPCPIVREHDGLAMSSRNLRLTIGERDAAAMISSVLFSMKKKVCTMPVEDLKQWAVKKLQSDPLFRIDYLEIVDKRTLHTLGSWKDKKYGMVCAAVYVGDIRLIDNLELF